jgi:hypothetical protein
MRQVDIWRSACLLLEVQGDKAWQEVARQLDKAVAEGNPVLADTWRRIAECLADMALEAPERLYVH